MKKVMIIGSPGAGKSTFSRKLRDITGLDLYYLDMLWHKSDKTHISREEFDAELKAIIKKDNWIIDGNYQRTLEIRLKECDTVFLMDYPLEVCLSGAEARIGKEREDLPWFETEFDQEFKQWILDFPKDQLPEIYEMLEKYKDKKNIIIFKSREEASEYLTKLKIHYVMQEKAEIETERLILRRITLEDAPAVAEIMRSKGVQRVWEHYFSDEDVKQWIERRLNGYERYGIDYLLAVEKQSGNPVGQIGLLREEILDHKIWGVGWILRDDCQGRGYATEGARGIVDYAFQVLGLEQIECDIRPENKKSLAVAERLGMSRYGSFVKNYRGVEMVHDLFRMENKN